MFVFGPLWFVIIVMIIFSISNSGGQNQTLQKDYGLKGLLIGLLVAFILFALFMALNVMSDRCVADYKNSPARIEKEEKDAIEKREIQAAREKRAWPNVPVD